MRLFKSWILVIPFLFAAACYAQAAPPTRGTAPSPNEKLVRAFVQLLGSVDWESADQETARAVIQRGMVGSQWILDAFSLNRYATNTGMDPNVAGGVITKGTCIQVADVVRSLGPPHGLTLAPPFGFLNISTPELVEQYLEGGHIRSLQYVVKPPHSYWLDFGEQTGCLDHFYVHLR